MKNTSSKEEQIFWGLNKKEIDEYFANQYKQINDKYRPSIALILSQSFWIRMKWWKHFILNGISHYLTEIGYVYFVQSIKWRYITNKIKELFEKEDWEWLEEYLSSRKK